MANLGPACISAAFNIRMSSWRNYYSVQQLTEPQAVYRMHWPVFDRNRTDQIHITYSSVRVTTNRKAGCRV